MHKSRKVRFQAPVLRAAIFSLCFLSASLKHTRSCFFFQLKLWFDAPEDEDRPATPDDPQQPLPYDRPRHLKRTFFHVLADHASDPPTLNYTDMVRCPAARWLLTTCGDAGGGPIWCLAFIDLRIFCLQLLYFSVDPDPFEGFLRALSVSTGANIPRKTENVDALSRPESRTRYLAFWVCM